MSKIISSGLLARVRISELVSQRNQFDYQRNGAYWEYYRELSEAIARVEKELLEVYGLSFSEAQEELKKS